MGETLDYLESAFPDEPEQWGGDSNDVIGDHNITEDEDEEQGTLLPIESLHNIEGLIEFFDVIRGVTEQMAGSVPATVFFVRAELTGSNCLTLSVTPLKAPKL